MARLVKCPVCGKEMSDNTKQCPNCGYKIPVYHRLWFWLLIILFMGLLIYYMLPINHIVSISFDKEQTTAIETTVDEEEYTPITTDELLLELQENPESAKCYEGADLLIQGYISTLDESGSYCFVISGMEDNDYYANFYIYISEEQRELLQYYYTYGDVVTAYVHCNEVDDYYGFLCDLNWFVQ